MATVPRQNDVLFGKGTHINTHRGNRRFRSIADSKQDAFLRATKRKEKRSVVHSIAAEIYGLSPPGRFLVEDRAASRDIVDGGGRPRDPEVHPLILSRVWVPVEEPKVLDKIYHRLRDLKREGAGCSDGAEKPTANVPQSEHSRGKELQRLESPKDRSPLQTPSPMFGSSSADEGPEGGSPLYPTHLKGTQSPVGSGGNGPYRGEAQTAGLEGKVDSQTGSVNGSTSDDFSAIWGERCVGIEEKKVADTSSWSGDDRPRDVDASSLHRASEGETSLKEPRMESNRMVATPPAVEGNKTLPRQPPQAQFDMGVQSLEDATAPPPSVEDEVLLETLQVATGISLKSENEPLRLPLTLDDEVDSFLRNFSSQHDTGEGERMQELTLLEWIQRSKTTIRSGAPAVVRSYVISALPIALKLTECLIENLIPLASIATENVLLQTSGHQSMGGEVINEAVDHVWVMSPFGDALGVGGIKPRLAALGAVLYELFAAGTKPAKEEDTSLDLLSLELIDLNEEAQSQRSQKRPQKKPTQPGDRKSNCILDLEHVGIPYSLCALVGNLLGCANSDECGGDAYASLSDVRADLQLMLRDPSRFLDDIQTNPLPSLSICEGKIYGRDAETQKLQESYQRHLRGECTGVIISGGAGVGKSKLANNVVQQMTCQSNGYFLAAKFDQNKDLKPLTAIGALFNSLCDIFAHDAQPAQLAAVQKKLENALGHQASLLAGIVPSLSKLMPSLINTETSDICVNSSLSMRFLFGELLSTISLHSRISIMLDDVQWADSASLLLIGDLMSGVKDSSRPIFFTICYRVDDEASANEEAFTNSLRSIVMSRLERIELGDLSLEGANELVSDALHLSSRITQPLSSVLYHKTRGNALFLKQLLESLAAQKVIYVSLHPPRWTWDLKKIESMKIADSVLALLNREMSKLSSELQLGLRVASCIGSLVKGSVLSILSKDLGVDLLDALQQATRKGYVDCDGSDSFVFAHDKVQQAALQLMTEQEMRELCMRLGLSLCSHTMGETTRDDETFFIAVNLMNHGGPEAVHDPRQRSIIAELNLSAGRRSIDVSDCNTAFQLFKHGISFLGSDKWESHYELSLGLFDSAAEAACVLDRTTEVTRYSDEVFAHATSFDDKLNCFYASARALMNALLIKESVDFTFKILLQLGEEMPCAMGDGKLMNDIQAMNETLRGIPDDDLLRLKESRDRKIGTLLKLYVNLVHCLHLSRPRLVESVSRRMVALTLKNGLTPLSPNVFALYGEILMALGQIEAACRMGRLALKLLERRGSSAYKSATIANVYQMILWAAEPLPCIIDAHFLGHKCGLQAGDSLNTNFNLMLSVTTSYIAGKHLDSVQSDIRNCIRTIQRQNSQHFMAASVLLHSQTCVLKAGIHTLNEGRVGSIPTERELLANVRFAKNKVAVRTSKVHHLMRAVLFGQLDDISSSDVNLWSDTSELKNALRPVVVVGIFYQGLASFYLARKRVHERTSWTEQGDAILSSMKRWAQHSEWNWENKALLLAAEKEHSLGSFNRAEALYERAIRSAREHRFVHEEAIASELAGKFFVQRGGFPAKSVALLIHAARCYEEWGATAVMNRVKSEIATTFGPNFVQLGPFDNLLDAIFESSEDASKKRSADA